MKALVVVIAVFSALGCSNKSKGAGGGGKAKYPPGSGRPVATACPAERAPGNVSGDIGGNCKSDADCTAGQNGRCNTGGGRMQQNLCSYDACFTDKDCKQRGPCECNAYSGNSCLAGNCQVDADCASGSCGRSNFVGCWGGAASYWCRTGKDTCVSNEDCKDGSYCSHDGSRFTCIKQPVCPVG